VVSFLDIGNAYGKNNCSKLELALKNKGTEVLEKIESLKKCAKPAAKYRLKACIQRKQEGSKGFNCSSELIEIIESKKRKNCSMKFDKISFLFKQLEGLTKGYEVCL